MFYALFFHPWFSGTTNIQLGGKNYNFSIGSSEEVWQGSVNWLLLLKIGLKNCLPCCYWKLFETKTMLLIERKKSFPMETHLGTRYCYKANSNVNTEEISISMLLQCVLIAPAPGKTGYFSTFQMWQFQIQVFTSNTNYSTFSFSVTTPDFLLSDLHTPSAYLNASLKAGIPPSLSPAASQLHCSCPPLSQLHLAEHWPFHSSPGGLSSWASNTFLTSQCLETPQERGLHWL